VSQTLVEGSVVGRYRILSALGRGGTASVFLVEEIASGRPWAMKVLRGPIKGSRLARFHQEFALQARFEHPNLLTGRSFGHHGSDPWFVTKRVSGGPWSQLKGKFSSGQEILVASAVQVCNALSYVHDRGIVHRDVKPSNVLVSDTGQCYLIDFGLAILNDGNKTQERTKRLHGTLSYASPEQALGRPVDCRADLYCLGICLYELVTGKRPFVAADAKTVLSMHVYSRAMPPSSLEAKVPRRLGELIEALMEKQPSDRPQSAAEVAKTLIALG